MNIDGVFEGGGTLGTAYIGALRAMEDNGYWFERVAGTSAGAITASLVAAGYTAKEIEWLSAPTSLGLARPTSLPDTVTEPIDFVSFLDPPKRAADIPLSVRRRTLLWRAIYGVAYDEIRKWEIPIKTRTELTKDITDRIINISSVIVPFRSSISDVVDTALHFYPDSRPRLGDFLPPLERIRTQFADATWLALVNNPGGVGMAVGRLYLQFVHSWYKGGVVLGDKFLNTMQHLLNAKVTPASGTNVRFSDLPIELVVIAADTTSAAMEVYSRNYDRGKLEVAEAVRRSMSVPWLFAPRDQNGHEIMDGGICSNYPYWLFSPAGDQYWNDGDGLDGRIVLPDDRLHIALPDDRPDNGRLRDSTNVNRVKFGFSLNDKMPPPATWGSGLQPAFRDTNGDGRRPSMFEALAASAGVDIGNNLHWDSDAIELGSLERAFRIIETAMNKEPNLHSKLVGTIMSGRTFHEVDIPLLGYHWLDFSVNRSAQEFRGLADRGWQATMAVLVQKGIVRTHNHNQSPYRIFERPRPPR